MVRLTAFHYNTWDQLTTEQTTNEASQDTLRRANEMDKIFSNAGSFRTDKVEICICSVIRAFRLHGALVMIGESCARRWGNRVPLGTWSI